MKVVLLFLFGLVCAECTGQELADSSNNLIFNDSNKSFSDFISSIKTKQGSDRQVVKRLFNKAHLDFLRNYKAYSQVKDVFETGNFDCLSGTYFLACSLEKLGLSYQIFETNYHVFLLVETGHGEILLESTDRSHGLISEKLKISEKIASYLEVKADQGKMYLSKIRMFHELLPAQLPGLLYFNRAVEMFNKKQLSESCFYLEQAWKIYDNPRIEAFAPILIRSIENSELNAGLKDKLTSTLRMHLNSSAYSIASR